jgi:hypothetical protein
MGKLFFYWLGPLTAKRVEDAWGTWGYFFLFHDDDDQINSMITAMTAWNRFVTDFFRPVFTSGL